MAIVLILEIPALSKREHHGRRGARQTALRLTLVLVAVVLLVTLLAGHPVVAIVAVLILFALWLVNLIKWLPSEVTGVGDFLGFVFSRELRRRYRADVAERDAQAARGADLEATLRGVKERDSTAARAASSEERQPDGRA